MPDVSLPAWTAFLTRHSAGADLDGTVTSVLPFGALVELTDGVVGLLPGNGWSSRLEPGSTIPVRISAVDLVQRRVSLISI